MCSSDCLLVIIAFIFPPLPVWIKRGLCTADSLINIALCLLGFLPGMLHSWYIIFTTPDDFEYEEVSDPERGPVNTYYVAHAAPAPRQGAQGQWAGQYGPQGQMNYGTGVAGGSEVPPSYSDAIQGNNKVQSNK